MGKEERRKQCDALLIALLGKETAPKWWQSSNKAFDMKRPEDIWNTDYEKIYQYLVNYALK